jgi:hypothetical protein
VKQIFKLIAFIALNGVLIPLFGEIISFEYAKMLPGNIAGEYLKDLFSVTIFCCLGYALVLGFFYVFWSLIYLLVSKSAQKSTGMLSLGIDLALVVPICLFSGRFFSSYAQGEGWKLNFEYYVLIIPMFGLAFVAIRKWCIPRQIE